MSWLFAWTLARRTGATGTGAVGRMGRGLCLSLQCLPDKQTDQQSNLKFFQGIGERLYSWRAWMDPATLHQTL